MTARAQSGSSVPRRAAMMLIAAVESRSLFVLRESCSVRAIVAVIALAMPSGRRLMSMFGSVVTGGDLGAAAAHRRIELGDRSLAQSSRRMPNHTGTSRPSSVKVRF
jgi:hypothetical protein